MIAALEKPAALAYPFAVRGELDGVAHTGRHHEIGCQMTGDKFRARADKYGNAARAVTDSSRVSGLSVPY